MLINLTTVELELGSVPRFLPVKKDFFCSRLSQRVAHMEILFNCWGLINLIMVCSPHLLYM